MSDYTVLTVAQQQELLSQITAANSALLAIQALIVPEKKTRKPRKARKVAASAEAEAEPAAPKRRGRPPKMVEPAAEPAEL
jgi:hypothetical protein